MKEYDKNNKIINELNEGKWFIKEFNENGELIFEGEYIKGEKNGKGTLYLKSGEIKLESIYLYVQKIKGKEYFIGKLVFDGGCLYNRIYKGKGYDDNVNIIYEVINGNGKIHEYNSGTLEFDSEDNNINEKNSEFIFEGEYLNGNTNGKGK